MFHRRTQRQRLQERQRPGVDGRYHGVGLELLPRRPDTRHGTTGVPEKAGDLGLFMDLHAEYARGPFQCPQVLRRLAVAPRRIMQPDKILRRMQTRPMTPDLGGAQNPVRHAHPVVQWQQFLTIRPQSSIEKIQAAVFVVVPIIRQGPPQLAEKPEPNLARPHARFAPEQTGRDARRPAARTLPDPVLFQENDPSIAPARQLVRRAQADDAAADDDNRASVHDEKKYWG